MKSLVQSTRRHKLVFFSVAGVWLVCALLTSQLVAELSLWGVALCVLVFAVPIAIGGSYSCAVNQTKIVTYFHTNGWMYPVFSGRLIRSVLWIVWALVSSFVMLIQFAGHTLFDWAMLALSIPVFWFTYAACIRFLTKEVRKSYVITNLAIVLARWFCSIALAIVYGCMLWGFSDATIAAPTSLPDVLTERQGFEVEGGSSVVQLALNLYSFVDGTKTYLGLSLVQFGANVPVLLATLGAFLVFFNASVTFGSFVIPAKEIRRVFGPISDEDVPAPLTRWRLAASAAVITVLCIFIYLPLFAHIEAYVRSKPELLVKVRNAQRMVEKIDHEFYAPGTLKALEIAKTNAMSKVIVSRAALDMKIDGAFNQMEIKVDDYLDWYYSLSGEYTRLAKLMTGEIEAYMQEKLVEKLQQDAALNTVFSSVSALTQAYKIASEEYQANATKILDANRLQVPEFGSRKIPSLDLRHMLSLPNHQDAIAMEKRLAGSAGVAGIGGIIVGKLVGKGVFKAAAKALSKVAVSKVVGTGGGVLAGAAVGSVVPFWGTIVGGVVGGVIAGVAVDKALLKLEETYKRDEFKSEIMASIRHARDKLKDEFIGANRVPR